MTVPQTGIKSFGTYLPARRVLRSAITEAHAWAFPSLKGLGKGERTLCAWDEDVITMAVEAARDSLRGLKADTVASFELASTTAPYADLQNAVIAGYALSLNPNAACMDAGGSTRAGLTAVARACGSAGAGDRLIVAADRRSAKPASVQELQYGAGAAALIVGDGSDLIAAFLGSESISVPFVDHFRAAGEKFDYFWEERWIRDEGVAKLIPGAIRAMFNRLDIKPERVKHFGVSGGPTGSDKLVAKAVGIAPENVLPDLQSNVGDCGTGHSLLLVISALERAQAGDVIVVAAFAQGCQITAFEMLQPAAPGKRRGLAGNLARRIEDKSYGRMLSFEGHVQLDWGMRAEMDQKTALTQSYRSADQVLAFKGGVCSACHAVQFPRLPSCINCGAVDSQTPYPLADEPAQVATFTADWLQYNPSPPLYVGLVQFDNGARMLMEMTDVGLDGIQVGTRLEMRLRIKERDKVRHLDRYFWKAVPVL